VGVDENASQALHAKALDKAHTAHVSGQVINFYRSVTNVLAGFLVTTIKVEVLHSWNA
jgi:hypothetical protein